MAVNKKSRVSATEARVHFGEIMRRAEQGETLVVERSGEPRIAIVSIEEYNRLSARDRTVKADGEATKPEWQVKLEDVRRKASAELAGKDIDWDRVIHEMREERSRAILQTFEAGRRALAAEQDATQHD